MPRESQKENDGTMIVKMVLEGKNKMDKSRFSIDFISIFS